MRPSGTHLYKRVCPSIGPSVGPSVSPSVHPSVGPSVRWSVRPLRLCENRVSRLFLATVRSYTETNDQPTCFESLLYYSVVFTVCLSICLSIYVTWSIHAETQSGRIVSRSGLFLDKWYMQFHGYDSAQVDHYSLFFRPTTVMLWGDWDATKND